MSQFSEHRNGKSKSGYRIALIGIGANLPGPDGASALQTCQRAVAELDTLPGLRLNGLSRWYVTVPQPPSGQPDYVNAVASTLIEPGSDVDPASLLAFLLAIEDAHGRTRSVPDAARRLDLDLIAIDGCIRQTPDPVLPHPRAHLRAFVLAPLIDVAPLWVHPVFHRTAAALLSELPDQGIRLLADV